MPPRLVPPASLLCLLLLVAPASAPATAEPGPEELPAVRRLLRDPSPSARAAALRRLAGSEDPAVVALFVERLADPHPYVRRAAAGLLGTLTDPRTRRRLAEEAPRWRSDDARREACQAFALWLDETGLGALLAAAGDRVPAVRVESLRWLADEPAAEAVAAIHARTRDADPWVRAEALEALRSPTAAVRPPSAEPLDLAPLLRDADHRVRLAALEWVADGGGDAAVSAVVSLLGDPSWSVRLAAASRAAALRDRRLLAPLVAALSDARGRVVEAAGRALTGLTGIPFDAEPRPWRAWLEKDGAAFDPATAPPPDARPAPPPAAGGRTVTAARFLDLPIRSKHVAFVLDASGSMSALLGDGRTRWAGVLAELERALEQLGDAHVNVGVFADGVAAALPRALPLDAARRRTLLAFVGARRPGGRTALYDGIAWGLSDPEVDTLVVLSDGAPSAGAFFTKTDLLAEVRRSNRFRRARIDVIAMGGDDVARRWRDALETLATESGGTHLVR
jgi:HEAT repeat protein